MHELGSLFSGQRYQEGEQVVPVDATKAAEWIHHSLQGERSKRGWDEFVKYKPVDRERIQRESDLSDDEKARIIFRVVKDSGEKLSIFLSLPDTDETYRRFTTIEVPKNSVTIV